MLRHHLLNVSPQNRLRHSAWALFSGNEATTLILNNCMVVLVIKCGRYFRNFVAIHYCLVAYIYVLPQDINIIFVTRENAI